MHHAIHSRVVYAYVNCEWALSSLAGLRSQQRRRARDRLLRFFLSLSRLKAINQSRGDCCELRFITAETSESATSAVAIQFFDCNLIKTQFVCRPLRWVSTINENSCVPPKSLYRQEPKFWNLRAPYNNRLLLSWTFGAAAFSRNMLRRKSWVAWSLGVFIRIVRRQHTVLTYERNEQREIIAESMIDWNLKPAIIFPLAARSINLPSQEG